MDKDLVVKVLQDEDFFPDFEIQILVHKFLVKNSDNKYYQKYLLLHDVIREMGQEVVRQEDEDEPGKRTRLMGRDVVRVLEDCSGTDSVRSIKLNSIDQMTGHVTTVQLEAFKKMSNLRFITLVHSKYYPRRWSSSNDDMSACFSFKRLKYLEWLYFPCKSLDNIDMGNVVVIKLYNSKLEKLWEGTNKNFKKLKILHVTCSHSLTKTVNFIGLENLEELSLYNCENLEELDSSIGCLQKLVKLSLDNCKRLKRIPDLPPSIKDLCLGCCKLGSEVFTQITRLRNLQVLDMSECNISQVSSGIGNLVSLSDLNLSTNTFSSLPESFSNLSKLDEFVINGCSLLQSLPPLPSQLKYIRAIDCGSLNVMPFDSMQKAYTFHSKMFKESTFFMNTKGLYICLSGEELPEWCTYRTSGNKVLSFEAPIPCDSKICGLILCATANYDHFPTIHNKTKEKSQCINTMHIVSGTMQVVFYPLNDKTVVVEAGDTVELRFDNDNDDVMSCGLRLMYEEDVVDSGLVLPS